MMRVSSTPFAASPLFSSPALGLRQGLLNVRIEKRSLAHNYENRVFKAAGILPYAIDSKESILSDKMEVKEGESLAPKFVDTLRIFIKTGGIDCLLRNPAEIDSSISYEELR